MIRRVYCVLLECRFKVEIGDLDADGRLDTVAMCFSAGSLVRVFLSTARFGSAVVSETKHVHHSILPRACLMYHGGC